MANSKAQNSNNKAIEKKKLIVHRDIFRDEEQEVMPASIDFETTPKEMEAFVDEPAKEPYKRVSLEDYVGPEFYIPNRRRRDFVDKLETNLAALEEMFITEQERRMNSTYTIKHYEATFKRLYEFLAFTLAKTQDDLERMEEEAQTKNFLVEYGATLPLNVLDWDDLLVELRYYCEDVKGNKEQTVLGYYRDFKAIYSYCVENGWLEHKKIIIPSKEAPIKEVYTNAEIERLITRPKTDSFVENRNWVIIHWLLGTGSRVQTIINLKVGDIDLDEGYANINIQKNGSVSRIPLVKKLQTILSDYIYDYRSDIDTDEPLSDEWLFPNRFGEKMTDDGLKKAIVQYNTHRNVYKTSIHLFRHTFAKEWIISGGDILTLQKMLGHKSLKMVQHYSNLYERDIKEKAENYALITNTKRKSGKTIQKRS